MLKNEDVLSIRHDDAGWVAMTRVEPAHTWLEAGESRVNGRVTFKPDVPIITCLN